MTDNQCLSDMLKLLKKLLRELYNPLLSVLIREKLVLYIFIRFKCRDEL